MNLMSKIKGNGSPPVAVHSQSHRPPYQAPLMGRRAPTSRKAPTGNETKPQLEAINMEPIEMEML